MASSNVFLSLLGNHDLNKKPFRRLNVLFVQLTNISNKFFSILSEIRMSKIVQINGISTIILDIEGTTTPISFVKNILFGYIRENLKEFLDENYDHEWLKQLVLTIPQENVSREDLERIILECMSQDSKISWLKNFQGKMWNFGYESGLIKGQVYPDVAPNFENWAKTFNLGIYSSGSIHAQKLLFKYSESGNLSRFLKFHFDTMNAGPKTQVSSYKTILKEWKSHINILWEYNLKAIMLIWCLLILFEIDN